MRVEMIASPEGGSAVICHHEDGGRTIVGEVRGMVFDLHLSAYEVRQWNYREGARKGVATRRARQEGR